MFGRRQDVSEVMIVDSDTLFSLSMSRVVNNMIPLDNGKYLVSVSNNINTELLSELNLYLESNYISSKTPVNSNVAIASAVTAYGRILMMQFKVLDCVVYSDTDSLFTTDLKPFLHHTIG